MHPQWQRQDIKEALDFAQGMANQEIASIERLHQRTVKQLTILAAIFVSLLGILGALFTWIGYSTIKEAAVRTAQTQMQQEVVRQVQGKLTKERIDEIVKGQVSNYSKAEMDAAIERILLTEPLRSEIHKAAVGAAASEVKSKFTPRRLTDAACKAFAEAVASYDDLDGYSVSILHNAINNEAETLEADIAKCIPRTRLKLYKDITYSGPFVDGVGLFYYSGSPKVYVQHLQAAFASVGIETKLVPEGARNSVELGEKQPISVWVGSKEIE
jgi:hypothetical protein